MNKKIQSFILYFAGILITLITWWLITLKPTLALHRFNTHDTLVSFLHLVENKNYWESILETIKRLLVGVGIATLIGVPVGLLVGYFSKFNRVTYVTFQFLRMISPLSWTPVAIILFGIGSKPVYFLVAIAAIWPIIINTAAGVRAADKQWIEVARCLGGQDKDIIRFVLIRASMPSLLVGIQLALGVAWIVIVPAEMLGVSSGLGYLILDFRDINEYSSIMAVILTIGFLGLMIDMPLRKLVKKYSWN